MMLLRPLLGPLAALTIAVAAQATPHFTLTGIPSQSTSAGTNTSPDNPSSLLAPETTDSYAYAVTTPTTAWSAPTFAPTAATVPACSDSMCPGRDGKNCIDSDGVVYGVLCDTRFSGTVITNSGKKFVREEGAEAGLEERDYTGTFEDCVGFCDTFSASDCLGLAYHDGYCMAFDAVTGSFNATGEIAALRKNV